MKLYSRKGHVIGGFDSMPGTLQCLHIIVIRIPHDLVCPGDVQLIQPKLQNRQQKAPETTSQASSPPSGKALGSTPACDLAGSAFSTSEPDARSATSGPVFASVWEVAGSKGYGDGDLSVSIDLFSSATVEAELEPTMMNAGKLQCR